MDTVENTEQHFKLLEKVLKKELGKYNVLPIVQAIDNYIVGRVAELTGQPIPQSKKIYPGDLL